MDSFAVFGNPIEHSMSPEIYSFFAEETGITASYGKRLATITNFKIILEQFFISGGMGANITMPLKEHTFMLCKNLTKRATVAGAVNVLKKQHDGSLLGDNTDGIGLLADLQRLGWLNIGSKILLVGSGGAARGIIFPLLTFGCQIILTNRTLLRAQKLANFFHNIGNINVVPFNELCTVQSDVIINATSAGVYGKLPNLPNSLINSSVSCYDLFYQKDIDTPFIRWCKEQGAVRCSDGLGMLVGQAAYSFLLWHNLLPSISLVLQKIRPNM
ncbi:shikimate dehydrogenase [Blochmannia endosymbiont of Camponotus (Colobopsis) obliquus]|uniref:shikimate dehydrogenase n=1 Tax=Blochmannia endosymbiont of Camponotus (Colobopsis) obliquus TaxID=1505597 RepID=UPI00061A6205|nr:shikimate dehydrogenase [Blochmannia endosymbiont of Camponotus (Colobopsis) obliquus]AKC60391.1 shikimate dehydrogenase [Blochmannia endosymbiont of Camponotus (Colobopsis) obliquus]